MRVSGILFAAVLTSMSAAKLGAQGGNAGRATAPSSDASARSTTLKDFTGYWVSVVTEDWRWRMVVPDKGDYVTIPLNADGRYGGAIVRWLDDEWARGNNVMPFTPAFDDVIARKLRDPEWAFLRTDSQAVQGWMGFGS